MASRMSATNSDQSRRDMHQRGIDGVAAVGLDAIGGDKINRFAQQCLQTIGQMHEAESHRPAEGGKEVPRSRLGGFADDDSMFPKQDPPLCQGPPWRTGCPGCCHRQGAPRAADRPEPPLQQPQQGRWRLESVTGAGGVAPVWRLVDEAVKLIHKPRRDSLTGLLEGSGQRLASGKAQMGRPAAVARGMLWMPS